MGQGRGLWGCVGCHRDIAVFKPLDYACCWGVLAVYLCPSTVRIFRVTAEDEI